ncbi:hypothetical protein ACGFY9_28650 [Streptomyces sp. NPDC048504]|uniref:hypothetical protein n=1 Tax=Streptomyces sp. NPDC048504 TaxID=3365559 RepID=UPI0037144603
MLKQGISTYDIPPGPPGDEVVNSTDAATTRQWYAQHLGIAAGPHASVHHVAFELRG